MGDGGPTLYRRVDRQTSGMDRHEVELRLSRPREAAGLIASGRHAFAESSIETPRGGCPALPLDRSPRSDEALRAARISNSNFKQPRNHPRHPEEAATRPSRRTTAPGRSSFEARFARTSSDNGE